MIKKLLFIFAILLGTVRIFADSSVASVPDANGRTWWCLLDDDNCVSLAYRMERYVWGDGWHVEYRNCVDPLPGVGDFVVPNRVRIPAGDHTNSCAVVAVGQYAFGGLGRSFSPESKCLFSSVTIPHGVTVIDTQAFSYCTNLMEVVMSNTVSVVGAYSFSHCTNLRTVKFSDAISFIGAAAFSSCSNLTGEITFPDGQDVLGVAVLEGCRCLTSVVIPSSVKSIESSALRGCASLTSLSLPNGVTNIGSYAFADCTGLEEIVVPESVKTIGTGAFSGCVNLRRVVLPSGAKIDSDVFKKCCLIREVTVPVTYSMSYLFPDSYCNLTSVDILSSGGALSSNFAAGCSNLTSVVIPPGVTNVGDYAFCRCGSLATVIFPPVLTRVGTRAFADCPNLQLSDLPVGISYIGDHAFYKCGTWRNCMGELELGNDVYVGDYAFYDGSSIRSLKFLGRYRHIGTAAFEGCYIEEDLVIPAGGTICNEAFALNLFLNVMFDDTLWEIDDRVSPWTIGDAVFAECPELTAVYVNSMLAPEFSPTEEYNWYWPDFDWAGDIPCGPFFDYEDTDPWDRIVRVHVLPESLGWMGFMSTGVGSGLWPLYNGSPCAGSCPLVVDENVSSVTLHANGGYYVGDSYFFLSVVAISGSQLLERNVTRFTYYRFNDTTIGPLLFAVEVRADQSIGRRAVDYATALSGGSAVHPTMPIPLGHTDLFAQWPMREGDYVYPAPVGGIPPLSEKEIADWIDDLSGRFAAPNESAASYRRRFSERFGENLSIAYLAETGKIAPDGSRHFVWHDYIAQTDPMDVSSSFVADIRMKGNVPIISWRPAANGYSTDGAGIREGARRYLIYGKKDLKADEKWTPVQPGDESLYRFFRVAVEMPPEVSVEPGM